MSRGGEEVITNSSAKKHRTPSGVVSVMCGLLGGADSAHGAGIGAGAAIQAGVGVDHIGRIALGDSAHGAGIGAGAAHHASGADLISHSLNLHSEFVATL